MTWPKPESGLVIRYSYLWRREAETGLEEGGKPRPSAVLLVIQREDDRPPLVRVLPITHVTPTDPSLAIEIPHVTKRRLGLDEGRSWVVLSESNEFRWPGPDLRPSVNGDPSSAVIGMLPPNFFIQLRTKWLQLFDAGRSQTVRRTD